MSGRDRGEEPRLSPPCSPSREQAPGRSYDAELPFLAELEREIARAARRAASRRATPVHVRRGARRAVSARIARRSLTLLALLCLIAATAYGADRVLSGGSGGAGGSPNPTLEQRGAFVLVAAGGAGSERWSLRLYRRGEDLCRVLVVADTTEASRCAPSPGSRTVGVTSAVGPLRRYVFGVTGGAVARVAVRAGDADRTVLTRAPDPAQTRAGGLPARTRWFVAILPRPIGAPDPPALVRGLGAAGIPVGPTHVNCAPTPNSGPCP